MSKVRLAVVGAGHLGRFHARLAATLEHVELVAVVDPVLDNRCRVAQEASTQPLADYRELIGKVDAAVVAAPTDKHCQIGTELLAGGVHVLVEKPIASTLDEARQLVAMAQQHQRILQVGHIERFNPAINAVAPIIGDVKYVESVRASGYTFRSTDIGAVLDIMIHDLDLLLTLVKSPLVDVQAVGMSLFGGHEDMAQARLRFANGCVANLTASRSSFEPRRRMQIYSTTAFADIDFGVPSASVIRPDQRILDGSLDLNQLSPKEQEELRDRLFDDLLPRQALELEPTNALLDELVDFVTCVDTGDTPRVTGAAGLDALAVATKILESISAHDWNPAEVAAGTDANQRPILRGPHWNQRVQRKAG